jgi:glycosyltransferase involved in cell wall biosynthesis
MKKNKVAIIHNIISPYRQPVFEYLSKEISIDLTVYYCAKTHKNRKWNIINNNNYKNEVLRGITLPLSEESFYHINPSVAYKLLKENFDVIIIGGSTDFTMQFAFFITKLTRTKIILWSEGFDGTNSIIGKLISPIINFMINNVNAIIVPGRNAFDYHKKICHDDKKIFKAPNIVNNDFFIENCNICKKEKDKLKKDLSLDEKKVVLFVGQLIERKGVHYLLNAYKMLKNDLNDLCLIIVGEGPLMNDLKELCKINGINDVIFTGWLSKDKLLYYSVADLFVLPSLKDLCPLVLNEAMCCKLPIVTTEMVGCAVDMVIPGKNGYIVNIENSTELCQSMKKIFRNDPDEMGEISGEIINEKFMIHNAVNGFLNAINFSVNNE